MKLLKRLKRWAINPEPNVRGDEPKKDPRFAKQEPNQGAYAGTNIGLCVPVALCLGAAVF